MTESIALSATSPELQGPLLAAMAIWNEVPCGRLKLILDPNSPHQVVIRPKHDWPYRPEVLAMTTYQGPNKIRIDVNQGGRRWTELDYQNILLHELGHVLGLGHSDVQDSVMAPSGYLGAPALKLAEFDRAKLCEIEPTAPIHTQTGCSQAGYLPPMDPTWIILAFGLCFVRRVGIRRCVCGRPAAKNKHVG